MNGFALSAEEERDERGENHRGEAGITAAAGASAGTALRHRHLAGHGSGTVCYGDIRLAGADGFDRYLRAGTFNRRNLVVAALPCERRSGGETGCL